MIITPIINVSIKVHKSPSNLNKKGIWFWKKSQGQKYKENGKRHLLKKVFAELKTLDWWISNQC